MKSADSINEKKCPARRPGKRNYHYGHAKQRALVRNINSRHGLRQSISDLSRGPLSQSDARLRRLVERIHALGPGPLLYFMRELMAGADLTNSLERYAQLPADFIRAYGGDRLPQRLTLINGRGRS